MSVLVWRQPPHSSSGHWGTVPTLPNARLFSISWGIVRHAERPWHLHCYLAGFKERPGPHDGTFATVEAAQEYADQMFARYLTLLMKGAAAEEATEDA